MLAKYIPGAIWAPAARVVAARRAGVTDAALVTSSMLLEAGLSAVAGVIVFVVSLPFVDNVHAPLGPLVAFGGGARHPRPAARLPAARRLGAAQVRLHEGAAGHARADDQRAARLLRGHVDPRRLRALAAAALGRRASRGRRRSSTSAGWRRSARSSPSSSSSRRRASAARGLDVRAAARGRHARAGARRGRAEPGRADAASSCSCSSSAGCSCAEPSEREPAELPSDSREMHVLIDIGHSLREAFFMFWATLWALILGFGISGAVQAFVPRVGDGAGARPPRPARDRAGRPSSAPPRPRARTRRRRWRRRSSSGAPTSSTRWSSCSPRRTS